MEFLFRDRAAGKRQIKPSQDIALLEDTLALEESDDSEYRLEDDDDDGNDNASASSASDDDSGASDDDDSDSQGEKDADLAEERDDLNLSELVEKYESQKKASNAKGIEGLLDAKHLSEFKVCGACLGQSSSDANEIVECDGCGIAVHEGCYGVTESGSVASTVSSASTEPWFCEPCRAGLKKPPTCDLCPSSSSSGVFKETDVGRWVHLACALYLPGVAFADPDRLTNVTIFEMNYSQWGKRTCSLCPDARMSRTGVCVQCDAGMCKSYFHASCAQAAGLLCEPRFLEDVAHGSAAPDPYLAHCSIHTDKAVKRNRRRAFLTHQVQTQSRAGIIQKRSDENPGEIGVKRPDDESEDQRILRKLAHSRNRFTSEHLKRHEPWLPTQRIPRLLTTSASAVTKLQRMGELKGMDVERQRVHEQNVLAVLDVKKKWNVPPSLDVEFVAYFADRQSRIRDLKKSLAEQIKRHEQLRSQETQLRPRFELASQNHSSSLETNVDLRQSLTSLLQSVNVLRPSTAPQLPQPAALQPLARAVEIVTPNVRAKATVWSTLGQNASKASAFKSSPGKHNSMKSPLHSGPHLSLKTCALCQRTKDQHLLAHCDTCKKYYHLGCLSPPLTRMPKKSKLYGWQCSECHKDSSSDEVKAMDPNELEKPRKKRQAAARALALSAVASSRHNSDSDDFGPMIIPGIGNGERKKPGRKKSSNHALVPSPTSASPPAKMAKMEEAALDDAKQNLIDNVINADYEARKKEERERRRQEKKRRKEEKRRREREEAARSTIVEDPSSGVCVVTIEPKPLKLKIKTPVMPHASTNGVSAVNDSYDFHEEDGDLIRKEPRKKRSSLKERDLRTTCDKCGECGNNEDLVRCDECKRCYHFAMCLMPPLRKSPKVAGYSWHCNDCDPSEVDSDWHLD